MASRGSRIAAEMKKSCCCVWHEQCAAGLAIESQCDSDVTGRNLRDKRERGKAIMWSPGTFLFGTVCSPQSVLTCFCTFHTCVFHE